MPSLIGKALSVRNSAAPVPLGSGFYGLSTLATGGSGDEAYMRTFGTQGTVFANVALLASSTAKPPWRMFRKAVDGRVRYTTGDRGSDQRVEVLRHQALDVLNKPAVVLVNGREITVMTRFFLFELSQIWLETTGKSHWIVERDPRATFPTGLWPVRPDRMTPVPDKRRYLRGWIYTSPDGQEQIPLGTDEVIFNRYPNPLDTYDGLGPVQSVLTDVDSAKYASEWNRNFFINSAEPGGVISVPESLEDDEFDRMQERWREAHRGVSRAHRVALLENGATWIPTARSMRDMEFNAGRTLMRDMIREALGMHKVMTGVTDDVNRANAQTGEEVFASWKIVPRLDRWQDVLDTQYLPLFYPPGAAVPVELEYDFPMPLNREQDNAELKAKTEGALALAEAGYDLDDITVVVGLPPMGKSGLLPPGTTQPLAPGSGGQAAEDARGGQGADYGSQPDTANPGAQGDDVAARLRAMLSNGHLPVLTGAVR